ncbi:MAG TPA: tyrosine-protein phosphatase [Steroidobacteraceae bacterium]|nr:tyrosine-protein phosphatase [Steroidobacteraceae bacterium]
MNRTLICLLALAAAPALARATADAPAAASAEAPAGAAAPPIAPTPAAAAAAAARNAKWAVPIALAGVPNLHRITDSLYRSEQPTAEGFRNLEKLGIRTVINLRYFNSDDDEAQGTNLNLHRVRILTWRAGDDHVVEVMRLLRQKENGPFLIHCQHGADRTGLMSAMYRMLEQNWTPEEALAELIDGGYGFHSMWKNIKRYVLAADVTRLRESLNASGATGIVTGN